METKKCPKCGAEIPVEMSFCLHCMERTDGVLEIKKKTVPNRKFIAVSASAFAVMVIVIIILIFLLAGKNNHKNEESQIPLETTVTTTESVSSETTVTTSAESVRTELHQTTTSATAKQTTNTSKSDNSTNSTYDNNAEDDPIEENEDNESGDQPQDITPEQSPEHGNIPQIDTQTENTVTPPEINFEERFTERLNGWGASHVLTDTLSFSYAQSHAERKANQLVSVGIDFCTRKHLICVDIAEFGLPDNI